MCFIICYGSKKDAKRKILTPSVAGNVISDVVWDSRAVDGQAARLLLKAASQLFLPIVPQLLLLPAAAWLLLPVAVATNNVSVGVQRHFVADLLKTTAGQRVLLKKY